MYKFIKVHFIGTVFVEIGFVEVHIVLSIISSHINAESPAESPMQLLAE